MMLRLSSLLSSTVCRVTRRAWGIRTASGNVSLGKCVVEKVGQCVVVGLVSENKERRVNPELLQDVHKALDVVER